MPTRRSRPLPADRSQVRVFLSSTFRDQRDRRAALWTTIQRAKMQPAGMELFTARARPTLEACLAALADCDVLVGVIAHRFGWEPPKQRRPGGCSITQLEYREAGRLKIPRLMFVIDDDFAVVPSRDFDEGPLRAKKQVKLLAFKDEIGRSDEMPVPFTTDEDLVAKVMSALYDWHEEASKGPDRSQRRSARTPRASARPTPFRDYCKHLVERFGTIRLAGFGTKNEVRVAIEFDDLFVAQHMLVDQRLRGEARYVDAKEAEQKVGHGQESIALVDAFTAAAAAPDRRGLVLLGDPGSGKTTQLKRLLLWLAQERAELVGLPAGTLPVFVPLRELKAGDESVATLVARTLEATHFKQGATQAAKALLAHGRLLFLLDGLDEIGDPKLRGAASRWIERLLRDHPETRCVVTSRYAGYDGDARLDEGFLELHLRPLSDDQVGSFVQNWFRIVERRVAKNRELADDLAASGAKKLLDRLRSKDFRAAKVFELTHNPLMLTAICLVHHDQKSLPERRVDLYAECVDILLDRWRRAREIPPSFDAKKARAILQPLAYWMHSQSDRRFATVAELTPVLTAPLRTVDWPGATPEKFLETIRDESGLLVGWSDREFGFLHLGFQEYLAALEIQQRYVVELEQRARPAAAARPAAESVLDALAHRFGESWWNEVILLLLALEHPRLFEPLVARIVEQPAFGQDAQTALVQACLADSVLRIPAVFRDVLAREPGQDRGLWQRQLAALRALDSFAREEVVALAEKLAHHPLPGIAARFARTPAVTFERPTPLDLEFAVIPAGTFQMGSPDNEEGRSNDEGPVHTVTLSSFRLSRTPVTNAQYARFLEARPKITPPKYWSDRNFNQPNQPVVGVTWYEASSFCKWVGGDLPTEAQREYACRAGTLTRFWFGDDEEHLAQVAWYGKNSGDRVHAVAEKPANPWGLFDVHGNVLDWCQDFWRSADRSPSWLVFGVERLGHVARGGGYADDAQVCRSAFRFWSDPSSRRNDLGFRVALPAAPVAR